MQPINLNPEKVENVVAACVCLHNFLRSRDSTKSIYTPPGSVDEEEMDTGRIIPGEWRQSHPPQGMIPFKPQAHGRSMGLAKNIRNELCSFYCSKEGAVP